MGGKKLTVRVPIVQTPCECGDIQAIGTGQCFLRCRVCGRSWAAYLGREILQGEVTVTVPDYKIHRYE